jgi:hypothetical protein
MWGCKSCADYLAKKRKKKAKANPRRCKTCHHLVKTPEHIVVGNLHSDNPCEECIDHLNCPTKYKTGHKKKSTATVEKVN